ncbi:MAG: MFS transporter [Chitinophagaceae bacterium]
MPGATARLQSLSPLKEKEFRQYISFRVIYIMALRMVATVVGFKLFQLTHSSFAIGMVGLAEFIPVFSLALYAGHVIDKSDKRTLLLRGVICYCFCVAGLVLITSAQIERSLSTRMLEYLFYFIIFLTGLIRAFTGPTTHAIIAQLVPRNILHLAANISSSSWLIASIIGHASAGFFIAWFGVNVTLYIILGYVIIATFLLSKVKKKPVVVTVSANGTWASVTEGVRYVFKNKVLLGAISLDLFAVLFGGAQALIPAFSTTILKVGPIGFGWLNAAIDIGSVITIATLTFFPFKQKQGYKLLFAVGLFGLFIIIFGLSDVYWISFAALLLAGMMDGISVLVRGTILQLTTPDNMRGRVSAVNSMFINSSNELGMFESGVTARLLGTVPSVVFAAS